MGRGRSAIDEGKTFPLPNNSTLERKSYVILGDERYGFDTSEEADAFKYFITQQDRPMTVEQSLKWVKILKEKGQIGLPEQEEVQEDL